MTDEEVFYRDVFAYIQQILANEDLSVELVNDFQITINELPGWVGDYTCEITFRDGPRVSFPIYVGSRDFVTQLYKDLEKAVRSLTKYVPRKKDIYHTELIRPNRQKRKIQSRFRPNLFLKPTWE